MKAKPSGTLPLLSEWSLPEMLKRAIRLVEENEPEEGYHGAFSGGKDSIAVKAVSDMAELKKPVQWAYSVTTIDPPELFRFIREQYPEVKRVMPPHGAFFPLMEKKGVPPTRRSRWCCDKLKENASPPGATVIMGIRAEESPGRAAYGGTVIERFQKVRAVLPIFEWASDEVWEFIRSNGLPYPSLYDEGFTRLGCIGCPVTNAHNRRREFERWPAFERRWRLAFQRVWDRKSGTMQRNGRPWFLSDNFDTADDAWEWYVGNHDRDFRQDEDDAQGELEFGAPENKGE